MRHLLAIAAAIVVSTVLYVITYWFVLDFPLRFAYQSAILDAKVRYAQEVADQKKLVVISGSNSLYGISCARILAKTAMPCVNGGTAATFDFSYTVNLLQPYLRRGDIVYMPLEYNIYLEHTSPAFVGREALNIVMREPEKLRRQSALRAIHTLFYLDLAMALRSASEMMQPAHIAKGLSKARLVNRHGDIIRNSPKAAEAKRWYLSTVPSYIVRFNRTPNTMRNGLTRRLGRFLDWCRAHGIVVVGGLATFFDDTPLSDAALAPVRDFFLAHGQKFLVLENRSQYPRALFFDREAHLNAIGRRQHTDRVIQGLQQMGLLPGADRKPIRP